METNRIIDELKAVALLGWAPEQMQFLFKNAGYKAQQRMCYKNAADLVQIIEQWYFLLDFDLPVKYVEGYAYCAELLPIEHAFVKVGDKYIDPTFERALHRDVREEMYVSCIELDPETMTRYQEETGFYGELYHYDYMCKNRPELAERKRELNPLNRC